MKQPCILLYEPYHKKKFPALFASNSTTYPVVK